MANELQLATQAAQDAAIAHVATKATVWGYAGSVLGFLADNGVAIAVGTIVTVGGFIVNYMFQRRRSKSEQEARESHEAREIEKHSWAREEHLLKMKLMLEDTDATKD